MTKPHKITFAAWKQACRKIDLNKTHVSFDGEKKIVTVKFIK